MIYTGSRRYTNNPTIHTKLGPLVIESAFASFISPPRPLFVVLAVTILCNWPVSVDMVYRDPTHTLAGAAMNLAISDGSHVFCRENEFVHRSRERLPRASLDSATYIRPLIKGLRDSAVIHRTRLWAYCVIACQRYNLRLLRIVYTLT
jgi:hypothetical protein